MNNQKAKIFVILLFFVVSVLSFLPKELLVIVLGFGVGTGDVREKEDIKPTFSEFYGKPDLNDARLQVEVVAKNLELPTNMAFLGPGDFLVLEKNKGTVKRIVNGDVLDKPILDVNVANSLERGMLGISVAKNGPNSNVFLYFTEAGEVGDGSDNCYKNQDKNINCAHMKMNPSGTGYIDMTI
jgi:hypothetical protein